MKTEREVKVLDINIVEIIKKLNSLGATFLGEKHMKRYVYDFNPINPNSRIRLRDNGKITTLTIKEIKDDSISGTLEKEITTNSFEETHEIMKKLGYNERAFQENKRISYLLDNVSFEIDTRPMIPPYLEIEGENEEEVRKGVEMLGFSFQDTTSINTNKVYDNYGIDLNSIKVLSF